MDQTQSVDVVKDLRLNRRLLAIAGVVYLLWWAVVQLLLPHAFNPLGSRLFVVIYFFAVLAASYRRESIRQHIRTWLIAGLWLLTLHYYYLFFHNRGDSNWIVGSYITVIAINLCLLTVPALVSYSFFVLFLSVALVIVQPDLEYSVFLPGLVTIVFQANLSLRTRLGLIKTLGESNRRFQLLFDSTFEGVLVHENGIVTDVNASLVTMSGYTREELIGENVFKVIHPEDRAAIATRMTMPDVPPYEARGLRKDGSVIDIEVRAKRFQQGEREGRIVTVQDITDRKKAERERVAALALMENVRIRDEFISLASHELRTPISSLKLQTQLIEREFKKGSASYSPTKVMDFVALFKRQVDRLTELVESMLDVSRISAGRLQLDKYEFDLAEMIRDVILTLALKDVTYEGPERFGFKGDQSRLRQVIENLLTNATKYGEGKPVRAILKDEGTKVSLIFEDRGLGIAPEYVSRIFDRFERAVTGKNIGGLGLGLYIARQIVEAHEGIISVTSKLGAGSTFTVTLPKV